MIHLYEELRKEYLEKKRILLATQIAPVCGRKYRENEFARIGLTITGGEKYPFLHQQDGQEFFVEEYTEPARLVLAGGGHVSLAVAKLAAFLGFRITVIDDREDFASRERFPEAETIFCGDIETMLQENCFGRNTYYVILTRGHLDDRKALEAVLNKQDYRYAGMIGSRAKVATTMKFLREKGWTDDKLQQVHAPIGLPIGAITPEEIAVSIMAEIIQEMNQQVSDKNQIDILPAIHALTEPAVMVTIIEKQGSSPRGAGSKMLVGKSGAITGTIGGGMVEFAAIREAAAMIGSDRSEVRFYDLSPKNASNLGMICGGQVRVLLESLPK